MGASSTSRSACGSAGGRTRNEVEGGSSCRKVLVPHGRHYADAARDRTRVRGVIFVDSNIPMYLIGAAHPHKAEAQVILERLIAAGERLVTGAEVLQEILHRYTAIGKRDAIRPAFQVTLDIVDEVISIEKAEVLRAG